MALLFPRLGSPDGRHAVTTDDSASTYRELAFSVARRAAGLHAKGFAAGDRVGVVALPDGATIEALLTHALLGIVSVPISPSIGSAELAHVLRDAAPRSLFASDPDAFRARHPDLAIEPLALGGDGHFFGSLARPIDDAPLVVLYTSGTTGAPKGAQITSRNLASNIDALAQAWAWSERDTVVSALPLFHVHGLLLALFGSLRVGGALRLFSRFDPDALAAALEGDRSVLFAVPTMIHRLADAAESRPGVVRGLRAARLLISGSAALPLREHRRIESLTGRGVYERYGLTETLINCAAPVHSPPRPGYVGPPLAGVELRLVDPDRRPLAASDDATFGEIAVRSASVFAGYLNRPEATRAVCDEDGWFYTGDLATRSPDGAIRIVGRLATDLLKTGGFKVGAGEVEGALLEHPAVVEAAVVGVPDPDLGERIAAAVVLRSGATVDEEELVSWVACSLAPHKRPRQVRFVESLPRNAMGKVQKRSLVTLFTEDDRDEAPKV